MSKLIRKISIGKDYKNESMHYSVGQEGYDIFIKKNNDVIIWKNFNKNMAISVEYNLEF